MSDTVQCNQKQENVADDWENAGDDALVASVAERQKRIAQMQTQMAVEKQQLKIEQTKSNTTDKRQKTNLNNAPVRLLRRPQSGSHLKHKSDAELAKEAEDQRAKKELEEREAAYQQAREKIFGDQQIKDEISASKDEKTTECDSNTAEASTSGNNRDHLSDVPMKKADTYRPQSKMNGPVPPMPPMMYPPWTPFGLPNCIPPFTGMPPYNPYVCPPVTSAMSMNYPQTPYTPLNPFQMGPPPSVQNKNQQNRPIPLSSVSTKGVWNQAPQNMNVPPMLGQVQYPTQNYSQPKNAARFPNQ